MSLLESVLACLAPGGVDMQWFCLATLFAASIVTVLLYLLQYSVGIFRVRTPSRTCGAFPESEEADRLLSWALSLKNWKSQWQEAWFTSINKEAKRIGGPLQLTFQECGLQPAELAVSQVSSFRKVDEDKIVCCQVVGESVQFSLGVTRRTAAAAAGLQKTYSIQISPFKLQLELRLHEAEQDIQVSWSLSRLEDWNLQVTPRNREELPEGNPDIAALRNTLEDIICSARPSVLLSTKPADGKEAKGIRNVGSSSSQVTSPPKPPRAHDWKLLLKNIKAMYNTGDDAAGSIHPYFAIQLDDPPQQLSSPVIKNTTTPSWDQPVMLELSAKSKELKIQLLDEGKPPKSAMLGLVSVPLDLFKRHPSGLHTFALNSTDAARGSVSAEFTYLEPSELRSWQAPTPAPTKKVEMDRTVMPCGTVVTTVTAVKSKPGRSPSALSADSPMKIPSRLKLSERSVSDQTGPTGATVSKALSSSDTELLMLNGTDPVAEAAIRQLHESAKQRLRSPVKKSTIIISGVAKSPISQDDETALMRGYAAAMDASMTQEPLCAAPEAPPLELEIPELQEGPSGSPARGGELSAVQDPDTETQSQLSLCVSESGTVKKSKGGFLHKSARLFFRRRHHRKDPGMSQSHNDLVYLEQPVAVEKERKSATLSRIINRKLLPRNKSKSKVNGAMGDPSA
ncbi:C2 domain-containing protein 2-like [Acipenser ruthenus]|uniref:C2 domain-containing protein 2-like n=1 Tax=Acipenser ruthenus TaxID=7906 RepID=UPI0027420D47|nr:C2 domain-containing protein 2-like [Acipenser ruthenus]